MIYQKISPSRWEEEIGTQLTRAQWLGKLSITRKKLAKLMFSWKCGLGKMMTDKAIIRFQSERQSQMLKSDKYTLSDEEYDILTHHDVTLSTLVDLEDEIV